MPLGSGTRPGKPDRSPTRPATSSPPLPGVCACSPSMNARRRSLNNFTFGARKRTADCVTAMLPNAEGGGCDLDRGDPGIARSCCGYDCATARGTRCSTATGPGRRIRAGRGPAGRARSPHRSRAPGSVAGSGFVRRARCTRVRQRRHGVRRRRGHRLRHRRRMPGVRFLAGRHRPWRQYGRGVRGEGRQDDGPGDGDGVPGHRSQRLRRCTHPGGRGRSGPLRRTGLWPRTCLRRHPADLRDHGTVCGRRRLLGRPHRHGRRHFAHVRLRPGRHRVGHRGTDDGRATRRSPRQQVRQRKRPFPRRGRGRRPRPGPGPALLSSRDNRSGCLRAGRLIRRSAPRSARAVRTQHRLRPGPGRGPLRRRRRERAVAQRPLVYHC